MIWFQFPGKTKVIIIIINYIQVYMQYHLYFPHEELIDGDINESYCLNSDLLQGKTMTSNLWTLREPSIIHLADWILSKPFYLKCYSLHNWYLTEIKTFKA